MTSLGIAAVIVGAIMGLQWLWILGLVVAVAGLLLAASGVHDRLVSGPAHYHSRFVHHH